jgi:large-conductance mechanosensitive channel
LDVIDGKVSIGRTIAEYHGNKSKVPEIFVNDGILTVRSGTVQDTVHVTVYDTKERKATHSTEIRYENVLTKWQSFQIVCFWIFVIILAIRIGWRYVQRNYLNR